MMKGKIYHRVETQLQLIIIIIIIHINNEKITAKVFKLGKTL
jgi:hypothetical protein